MDGEKNIPSAKDLIPSFFTPKLICPSNGFTPLIVGLQKPFSKIDSTAYIYVPWYAILYSYSLL